MSKYNGGSTSQDTNAEDDEDEGDVGPAVEEEAKDDETMAELPQGPIDQWVQQMITA